MVSRYYTIYPSFFSVTVFAIGSEIGNCTYAHERQPHKYFRKHRQIRKVRDRVAQRAALKSETRSAEVDTHKNLSETNRGDFVTAFDVRAQAIRRRNSPVLTMPWLSRTKRYNERLWWHYEIRHRLMYLSNLRIKIIKSEQCLLNFFIIAIKTSFSF